MTRVLLMGAYGQDNLGDEAILEGHLQQLRDHHAVTVASTNPTQTSARYGVPSIRTYGGADTLRAFIEAEALVFGGGSLVKELNPPYFRHRLVVNLAAATAAARATGKGVAMSAMGVERLRTRTSRFLARRALDGCHLVLVRDDGSRRKVEALGARRAATVTADPAYLLEADADARERARSILDAADGRPVVALNPIRSSEVDASRDAVAHAFARLAEHAHEHHDAHVLLLPFKTQEPDSDLGVTQDVLRQLGHPAWATVAPSDLRPSDCLALLEKASAFAGMRHHGVLLALQAGCPTVAAPYAEKTQNLVEEFRFDPQQSVPAASIAPGPLVEGLDHVLRDPDRCRDAAAPTLKLMRARALENFRRLESFLLTRGEG